MLGRGLVTKGEKEERALRTMVGRRTVWMEEEACARTP